MAAISAFACGCRWYTDVVGVQSEASFVEEPLTFCHDWCWRCKRRGGLTRNASARDSTPNSSFLHFWPFRPPHQAHLLMIKPAHDVLQPPHMYPNQPVGSCDTRLIKDGRYEQARFKVSDANCGYPLWLSIPDRQATLEKKRNDKCTDAGYHMPEGE